MFCSVALIEFVGEPVTLGQPAELAESKLDEISRQWMSQAQEPTISAQKADKAAVLRPF
jgi:hypothetical protein